MFEDEREGYHVLNLSSSLIPSSDNVIFRSSWIIKIWIKEKKKESQWYLGL